VKFRILATFSVLLLSAPSALGVQRALAPTRGELAGWLAAVGIELAYLSLAFAAFEDRQRQRLASRVARAAVLTAITLNVLADYAARVPAGLSGAAQFLASFDWLLLALSVLESAPLATLAYTLATLLHTHSVSHPQPDASHTASHTAHHTAHTDTNTAHTQRTASYRCPHCGAALAKQQQYAAALRYGYCGKCKGK
jgi:ribosomal protein S27AE